MLDAVVSAISRDCQPQRAVEAMQYSSVGNLVAPAAPKWEKGDMLSPSLINLAQCACMP